MQPFSAINSVLIMLLLGLHPGSESAEAQNNVVQQEGLCKWRLLDYLGCWHAAKRVDSSVILCLVNGACNNLKRVANFRYLPINISKHHYGFQQP